MWKSLKTNQRGCVRIAMKSVSDLNIAQIKELEALLAPY